MSSLVDLPRGEIAPQFVRFILKLLLKNAQGQKVEYLNPNYDDILVVSMRMINT